MTPSASKEPTAFSRAVASEIRAEMAAQRLTGRALAADDRFQRGSNYLAVHLREDSAFDLNDLEQIADILGIDPAELVSRAMRRLEQGPEAPGISEVVRPKFGAGRKRAEMLQIEDEAAWDE